ncbi:phage tail protein [Pseudogracilibacillus auburnensis]|uniref:Phage minor structural protein n=1 Tax=Pseudogracilibacillus auburnensis TaxID=1494959 RepID=A0A2V3WJ77_9BACI|nr:carbohydrate binding domain-containing protein [Pseudogracilibacillus auburnensis]PXW88829.1 hypothetical protein DFR56_103335 [Pseudogracilibacillus auburnensis]
MSQIHILDWQTDEILDYIISDDIITDSHKRSLEDNIETFEFIAFADRSYSQHLEKRNRVIISDEDGSYREFVMFEVPKYRDTEGLKVQVFSHASYLELKKLNVIYPNTFKGTISQHAGRALNKTGWQVGTVEGTGDITININEHISPYENLREIVKEFDVELHFRIETDGRKVTGRYVDFLERIGEWQGRESKFSKDLVGIRRVEKQDVVTALLGLGPEKDDGSRIEVLVEDFDALERWGWYDDHGNLNHLIEAYEIQSERSEMTVTEARRYTRTALNKRINTQVTYECEIVDLEQVPGLDHEKIRFGDTIKIKDTSFNPPLYVEARVFEQERSIKSNEKKSIVLGDFIEYTEEQVHAIWEQLKKQIQNRVSYYEMVEHTYDRLTIDNKDEKVFEDGKTFAEATGITAEKNAKEYAVEQDALIKVDVESYAEKVSEQKANSALDQAKLYAVAKEVYENKMQSIANDISERAPIEYVDGQLVHAIDNLQIGGRNYIRNGDFSQGSDNWLLSITDIYSNRVVSGDGYIGSNYVESTGYVILRQDIVLKEGTYTASLYYQILSNEDNRPLLQIRIMDADNNTLASSDRKAEVTSGWERLQVTFTVTNETRQIQIRSSGNSPDFRGDEKTLTDAVQIEKGNKATDWSPAPEDMFSEIEKKADGSTVYTIEQIDNRLNNYVGITKYTTDQNGIINYLDDYGTRIGQNEEAIGLKADDKKVDLINNSLTEKVGEIETTAEGVVTSVSKVRADLDGLEYENRNLFEGGELSKYTGTGNRAEHMYYANINHALEKVNIGDTITISFDIKMVKGDRIQVYCSNRRGELYFNPLKTFTNIGTEKTRLSFQTVVTRNTGTVHPNGTDIEFYSIYDTSDWFTVSNLKIEKGNKATDWSPAPEDVGGAISSALGEIKTLAGKVELKASQDDLDSVEGRVKSAEGKLDVLPGEINAKVSKNGAFGELNLSPDRALLDFDRVNITGKLEAKHIKSLAGLNINDQFVVNAQGKVTIGNNRVTIDDRSISITRPDLAVWMTDGMTRNDYAISSYDPHFMEMGRMSTGGHRFEAFYPDNGFYQQEYGSLDGRGTPSVLTEDIRDSTRHYTVRFQRYEFVHSARYLRITYQIAVNSKVGKHRLHLREETSAPSGYTSMFYDEIYELGDRGVKDIIIDMGKPSYEVRTIDLRIGWNLSWNNATQIARFRIPRVVQTDFL